MSDATTPLAQAKTLKKTPRLPTGAAKVTVVRHDAEVSFKQIGAIYDLPGGFIKANDVSRFGLGNNVTRDDYIGFILTPDGKMRYPVDWEVLGRQAFYNAEGEELQEAAAKNYRPGYYRYVRVSGYAPFYRTFVEGDAGDLDGPYVYVWKAAAHIAKASYGDARATFDSRSLAPLYELKFDKGKFTLRGLSKEGEQYAGGGGPHTSLHLCNVFPTEEGFVNVYYFLVYPYPLADHAMMHPDLLESVPHRGIRLGDSFYTRRPKEKMRELTLFLVDPFREAVRRAEALAPVIDKWQAALLKLDRNEKYRLATRIQGFTKREDRDETLANFGGYLHREQKESERLMRLAELLAADCIRWIGNASQPERESWRNPRTQSFERFDLKRVGADGKEQPEPSLFLAPAQDFSNLFSESAADLYVYGCSDEAYETLCSLVYYVTTPMAETMSGRAWLEENLGKCYEEKDKPAEEWQVKADGGLGLIFRKMKEGVDPILKKSTGNIYYKSVKSAVGLVAAIYGEAWAKQVRSQALRELGQVAVRDIETFFKIRHGIDLSAVAPRAERRAIGAQERVLLKQARKYLKANEGPLPAKYLPQGKVLPPDRHIVPTAAKETISAFEKSLTPFKVMMTVADLNEAAERLRRTGDPWEAAVVTKHVIGLISDMSTFSKSMTKAKEQMQVHYKVYGKAAKCSPVALLVGVIDMGTAARDIARSTSTGVAVGHGVKLTSAAVSMASVIVVAAFPVVGAALVAVALALSALGDHIVKVSSDLRVFLAFSEWGKADPSLLHSIIGAADKDHFWFKGDLHALKGDVKLQHRSLNELMYDFTPELKSWGRSLHIEFEVPPYMVPLLESDKSAWDMEVTIHPLIMYGPRPSPVKLKLTEDDPFLIRADGKAVVSFPLTIDPPPDELELWPEGPQNVSVNVALTLKLAHDGVSLDLDTANDPAKVAVLKRELTRGSGSVTVRESQAAITDTGWSGGTPYGPDGGIPAEYPSDGGVPHEIGISDGVR